jgi:hypothetical protein
MGWFPASMAAQGRPDLTREVMLGRRDAFLGAALSRLTGPETPDEKVHRLTFGSWQSRTGDYCGNAAAGAAAAEPVQ